MAYAVQVFERFGQIHQATALRVHRPPGPRKCQNGLTHGLVRSELGPVKLRVAAAQVEAVDGRQGAIRERAPVDELGSRRPQPLEVLSVVEAECSIVSDADADGRGRPCPRIATLR